ncbi:hypothetical protein B0H67DRAFT_545977 [Lasiosphaeris hirsuta]|uniref:Protein required for cell viability n=1 Tax=Lasiosphaeris hirsuta TaxID=260670 RepID=A0AA39ZX26_9PEZI|nr:hypothetical protein B0H67DRAFT_545977 [Lasiosphaeris hirsuta]
MEQPTPQKTARQKLIESIADAGSKAFDPDATEGSRAEARQGFDNVIQSIKTLNLIPALNVLIRPGQVQPWLRAKLKGILAVVPLRPDGVRGTLEFVFAVHPSSTAKMSEAATPQKRGANITHEALELASRLVSVSPSSVPPETWFAGISPQLLQLLDGGEGQELVKAAAYIIGFGVLGRKVSGAPGTAGWKFFAEPMLNCIRPPPGSSRDDLGTDSEEITDLSTEKVLVQADMLATALHRLRSLVGSHPNPGLCRRLLSPLLLPLWSLSSWPDASSSLAEKICTPVLELLGVHLKLTSSPDTLLPLIHNLGYMGGWDKQAPEWVYAKTKQGELQIVETTHVIGRADAAPHRVSLDQIDQKIPKLMELLESNFSDADISTAFLDLLGRWLQSARKLKASDVIVKREKEDEQDPVSHLTEVKLLQAMMNKFPEKLASQPKHILGLVSQVLGNSEVATEDEGEDDDVTGVALSLLNMVITVPGFQKSRVDPGVLQSIETSLDLLSRGDNPEISKTARNLSLLLRYRDEIDDLSGSTAAPTDRQIEDRKTYNLAISYISQLDSPPPVKMEGLSLISDLIVSKSPILDIPAVLVLMSSLISDSEDYINLQVIKIFTLLASKHPKAVTIELLDHYIDPKETATVDTRLRFGEALLQVIERLGETFTGETAKQVGDALLAIASRRGQRPKTEARQARDERRRQHKVKEAEKVWEGPVPDMSDSEDGEDVPDEERERNAVLSKIVEGWESRRGTEDVRVRASALSILGNAVETNVAGLGPTVVSNGVGMAVSILQLETELEKGVLRRAAVLFVMAFLNALNQARQLGQRLGFGLAAQEDLMRTLRYVAETDVDGLVRQHANDVRESLENWQMIRLLPEGGSTGGGIGGGGGVGMGSGLSKLAGLEVDLGKSVSTSERPRIEEIE